MGVSPSVAGLIEDSLTKERSGDLAASLSYANKALALARLTGDAEAVPCALVAVARSRFRLGQYVKAHDLAEEALSLAAPEASSRANALLMLGMCASEAGSLADAEGFYQRAADLARELGDTLLLFRALNNLGSGVYLARGQFDLALAASREAYRLAQERGLDDWLPYSLITLAWVYQLTGRREPARKALAELRLAASSHASARGYHACLSAAIALDEGDLGPVLSLLAEARTAAESLGDPALNIDVRLGMGRYYRKAGFAAAAREWADDGLRVARRIGYRHREGQALIERAWACWSAGDPASAEADLDPAVALLSGEAATYDLARAQFLRAAIRHQQGSAQAARAWQEAARTILDHGYAFLLEQERTLAFPLVAAYLNDPDSDTAAVSAALLVHLEHVPPPALSISALGRFEVRQGTHTIAEPAPRQRRSGELFRLLLVSGGRSLTREQAIEALWPDRPLGTASTSFHQATSALRHALEPDLPEKFPSRYLEVEGGRLALHLPPGSWLDWEAFETHVRRHEWAEAVALYGGELFPEDRYADWAARPRERLAELFVHACLALAEQALDEGRPDEALSTVRRILEVDPWHERAVLLGMRACEASDNRTGALRLYGALERTLREELGIAPQIELQALYRSLCSDKGKAHANSLPA